MSGVDIEKYSCARSGHAASAVLGHGFRSSGRHHAWAWRQKEISSSDSNNRPVGTDRLCGDW
ncbi:hypothetical protein A2J04_05490 [Rhodococcus sp. EPR-279]|nr:hypothetical protein A2J04_05490 [Rhodococcus sp. EPR-279]